MAERNLDFDRVVDRRNTRCLKFDFAVKRGYPEDVLPLWVADMDFRTSSYVEDALAELTRHNIYGYTNTQCGDGFFEAVSGWMKRHHRWNVDPSWHVKTPGVCFAIAAAIRAFTRPDDAVIIQQPVYYPFERLIRLNGRKVITSDLVQEADGRYRMDPDDFEQKIIQNNVKLFILCSPHNPVGRVWTAEELRKIGRICGKHHATVFSDEIHFDFTWEGEHHVFQEVEEEFRDFTVTATSPSKTFNLAGLQQSNIFIPNPQLRCLFRREVDRTGYDEPTSFGIAAAQAAYENGDEWYTAMKAYVDYVFRDVQGNVFAQGTSLWVMIDIHTRKPVPCSEVERFMAQYDPQNRVSHPRYHFFNEGKFGDTAKTEHRVTRLETDFNGHMNNRDYLRLALSVIDPAASAGRTIREIHLKFLQECVAGEMLDCLCDVGEGGEITIRIAKPDGTPACLVSTVWR